MEQLTSMINEGKPLLEMWKAQPALYLRNQKQITGVQALLSQARKREKLQVRYYYGETGAGKSKRAEDEAERWCSERKLDPDQEIYRHNGSQWMDGYSQQKVIIIDDFEINRNFTFKHLLKLTDVYKYQVQVKGGSVWLQAELIIITASGSIEKFDEGKQFLRRVIGLEGEFKERYVQMWVKDRPDILAKLRAQGQEQLDGFLEKQHNENFMREMEDVNAQAAAILEKGLPANQLDEQGISDYEWAQGHMGMREHICGMQCAEGCIRN